MRRVSVTFRRLQTRKRRIDRVVVRSRHGRLENCFGWSGPSWDESGIGVPPVSRAEDRTSGPELLRIWLGAREFAGSCGTQARRLCYFRRHVHPPHLPGYGRCKQCPSREPFIHPARPLRRMPHAIQRTPNFFQQSQFFLSRFRPAIR